MSKLCYNERFLLLDFLLSDELWQMDFSKLCIHTATTKPWQIEVAMDKYAAAGVGGITVWRDALEGRDLPTVGRQIDESGLEVVSLCRGGFFPAATQAERQTAIDDNKKAIEEAAAIGAPLVVLVCGAVPGQPLSVSRGQIIEGIEAVIPDAEAAGVKLAIEPLHPMYADDRSAINSMAQANAACRQIDHANVGVAVDVYHLWWDDALETELKSCGERDEIFAYHICDWMTPTNHLLTDRGLMGEGCIDISQISNWVENAGFQGFREVEVFSERWWAADQDDYLAAILNAYATIYEL